MKKIAKNWISSLIVMGFLLVLVNGCKKDDNIVVPNGTEPTLDNTIVSNITLNSANFVGHITSDFSTIKTMGFIYNTTPIIRSTNINNLSNAIIVMSNSSTFDSLIVNLLPNTTYYVCSFAINSIGNYGFSSKDVTFTTKDTSSNTNNDSLLPILTTNIFVDFDNSDGKEIKIKNIRGETTEIEGIITSNGGSIVTKHGLCWSKDTLLPTITNNHTSYNGDSSDFHNIMTKLITNTIYHVRAYATNSYGTAYGNVIDFNSGFGIGSRTTDDGSFIFYNDGYGHGLVCEYFDNNPTTTWGCSGTSIVGTDVIVGSGSSNTSKILNSCTENCAAKICDDKDKTNHIWYLPSRDELHLAIFNLYSVSNHANFITGNHYWTSTQIDNTHSYSIGVYINGSVIQEFKIANCRVRAIRNF